MKRRVNGMRLIASGVSSKWDAPDRIAAAVAAVRMIEQIQKENASLSEGVIRLKKVCSNTPVTV